MPKQVSKIDGDGFYVEPVIVKANEGLSEGLIADPVPPGLFKPKWDGDKWVEGLSAVEAEAQRTINNQHRKESALPDKVADLEARLEQLQLKVDELTRGG
jgi:hypothetical protein